MTEFDWKFNALLYDIVRKGEKRETRNYDTKSLFAQTLSFDLINFPILTIKEVPFRTLATELLWFLRGDTNIKYLLDNNCNIWNGDAYKYYEKSWRDAHQWSGCNCYGGVEEKKCDGCRNLTKEQYIERVKTDDRFSRAFGDLGWIYGEQWRGQKTIDGVDQISNLIEDIQNDPTSRRLLVNSYNPSELYKMALPPCHYAFQVYLSEGKIDMLVNMRSSDVPLGLPFNVSSYALLTHILGRLTGYVPGRLTFMLGDAHVYMNQMDAAEKLINTYSEYNSPTLYMRDIDFTSFETFLETATPDSFVLKDYKHCGKIFIPLNN